jgi:hypothetical protein
VVPQQFRGHPPRQVAQESAGVRRGHASPS